VEDMLRLSMLITERLSLDEEPLLFMARDFCLISPEIVTTEAHKLTLPHSRNVKAVMNVSVSVGIAVSTSDSVSYIVPRFSEMSILKFSHSSRIVMIDERNGCLWRS
jgi:hypothetical protein